MIVIGVDVHKQSVTAVAIDQVGRMLDEKTVVVGSDELVGWASAHGCERRWAVEDCRQLTRWLERQLLGLGEDVVRVPPKLMAPERRAGRARGKCQTQRPLSWAIAEHSRSRDCTRRRHGLQRVHGTPHRRRDMRNLYGCSLRDRPCAEP